MEESDLNENGKETKKKKVGKRRKRGRKKKVEWEIEETVHPQGTPEEEEIVIRTPRDLMDKLTEKRPKH